MPVPLIGSLVEDVLHRIFLHLRHADKEWLSYWVSVGALVSNVSSQWRAIASRDSSLWKDVFIGPASSPAMTRIVLNNAVTHNLRVFIFVPENMGGLLFKGFSTPFSTSMQLTVAQSTRWESLSVVSPFLPFLRISKMLSHTPLTQLHTMELISGLSADSFLPYGASISLVVKLLTENLRSLELVDMDGEAVRLLVFSLRGRRFGGLRTLKIVSTDLKGLEECRSDIKNIFPGIISFA
ncbi:hypothetical protein C0993_000471 [Termitomyces sp. T159_Od127]|nr:hypothetical protein C0993_000471 [Termitomyces sp. T159_Od127]